MSLAVVVPYFNPAGCKDIRAGHAAVVQRLLAQRVCFVTVELVTKEFPHPAPDYGQWRLTLTQGSCLRQRERLINYGLGRLRVMHAKLAWLDGVLLDDGWDDQLEATLDQYDVVQAFDRCGDCYGSAAAVLGWQALRSASHFSEGCWGVRRDVFLRHPLFDRHCLGGDGLWADAVLGLDRPATGVLGLDEAVRHYCRDVRTSRLKVGWLRGKAELCANSARTLRELCAEVLRANAYIPGIDVVIGHDTAVRWSSYKPELHYEVERELKKGAAEAARRAINTRALR